jgi:hypothetical protein
MKNRLRVPARWLSRTAVFIAGPALAAGLCQNDETTLFQCSVPPKSASICVRPSDGRGEIESVPQYRFGISRPEIIYPAMGNSKSSTMSYSTKSWVEHSVGHDESYVHFRNNGFDYYAYNRSQDTPRGIAFAAGVLVRHQDRVLADLRCVNRKDSMIDSRSATQFIPQHPFDAGWRGASARGR